MLSNGRQAVFCADGGAAAVAGVVPDDGGDAVTSRMISYVSSFVMMYLKQWCQIMKSSAEKTSRTLSIL